MTEIFRRTTLSRTADAEPVRIAYLEKGRSEPGTPSFVVAPGIWEPAERALPLLEAVDGHAVAVSFRGRGDSDTPRRGYDLEHHLGDLEAVVDASGAECLCLLGFSRGVGYALGYAARHRSRVAGMVLVDSKARHSAPQPGTADMWKGRTHLGRPIPEFIRGIALDGMERESREVLFWDELPLLDVPVLVLRGTWRESPIPSNVSEEDASRYERLLRFGEVIEFERSGHMIPDEEPERYAATVKRFFHALRKKCVF